MDIRDKIKLHFDDDFFKEEFRCGYTVTAKTKRIWAVEIDLLNELIRVCKKYNIKMCVSCGTLLGAVRHKGFIPWDDDIDVMLTRPEYEKLCRVGPKEFKHPYFFQNYKTDPQYLFGYSRLRNSLTTGYIIGYDNQNYNNGIYIDIFVMDGYIDDKEKLIRQKCKIQNYLRLADLYKKNLSSKNKKKALIKRVLSDIFHHTLFKCVSYDQITDRYEKEIQKYNDATTCVSLISHPMDFTTKYWCKKSDLEIIDYLPFENIMVPAPVNYDSMLRHMYGDYMQYPPVEKRGVWHEGILELDPDIPYKDFLKR